MVCYASPGKAYTMLAADENTSAKDRVRFWREARTWFKRSMDVWLDLRQHGTLREVDGGKPEEINLEIAKCDAALARLPGTPSSARPKKRA